MRRDLALKHQTDLHGQQRWWYEHWNLRDKIGWSPWKIYDEALHLLKCELKNPMVCWTRKSLSVRKMSSLLKVSSGLQASIYCRGSCTAFRCTAYLSPCLSPEYVYAVPIPVIQYHSNGRFFRCLDCKVHILSCIYYTLSSKQTVETVKDEIENYGLTRDEDA